PPSSPKAEPWGKGTQPPSSPKTESWGKGTQPPSSPKTQSWGKGTPRRSRGVGGSRSPQDQTDHPCKPISPVVRVTSVMTPQIRSGTIPDQHSIGTFEVFYRREYSHIVAMARAVSPDRSAAEDLAQESFAVAHRHWDRISRYEE